MKHNYHSHTVRCGHAVGTEREYIENGIRNGLTTIGFSDHSPYRLPHQPGEVFSVNRELASDYFRTLGLLRQEYRESHPDIRIPIGFEMEYLPQVFESSLQEIDTCAALLDSGERITMEYMILGQHFLWPDSGIPGYMGMPDDSEKRLAAYVDAVIAGMETGRFTYLAHPDLINFTGSEAFYEEHMREICIAAKELSVPLEVNLLGLHEHRNYPNDLFWHMVSETGCLVCMGCDAHAPERVGNPELIAEGEAFAKRFGITLLDELPLRNPFA